MAVSKTDFINYSRCPRYIFLDKVKNHPDNQCFEIDESNRDTVYEELKKCF